MKEKIGLFLIYFFAESQEGDKPRDSFLEEPSKKAGKEGGRKGKNVEGNQI